MKTVGMISAYVFGFVLGLVLLAPPLAHAQHGPIFSLTTHFDFAVHAAPNEEVRVTIVNPEHPDPASRHGNVEFEWKVEEGEPAADEPGLTTIEPGEARSFILDPRSSGRPIDGRAGVRRVVVSFELRTEAVDDADPLPPGVTVELVDVRTGETRMALLLPAVSPAREQ